MERPLGVAERALFELDRAGTLNFNCAIRVKGPLTEAALRSAIDALCERHILLRVRIVRDAKGTPWFRDGGAPPSLRLAPGADWKAEVEREFNARFPVETGPLVRFVLITHEPEDHTILYTSHHCVGDGTSAVLLCRDVVMAAAEAVQGRTPKLVPLTEARAMDSRFPASARGLSGKLRFARMLAHEIGIAVRYGKPVRMRRDREVPARERRLRVMYEMLDPAFVERLTARARAEETTVQGALSAAMILAVMHDAGVKGPARVSCGSPVNVRKELQPEAGEELGLYASMLSFDEPVSMDQGLWNIARAIRAKLVEEIEKGVPITRLFLMDAMMRLMGGTKLTDDQLADRWDKTVHATTGVTNIGRVPIETRFGPLSIERIHLVGSPSASVDMIAVAYSLHGQLNLNFIWTEPVLSESHTRALVDDTLARVREAVDGPAVAKAS